MKSIVPAIASRRLSWPPTTLSQCGVFASSWSASHTFAPEFSALIVIFRSVGPVISTRRSTSPGAARRPASSSSSRTSLVSGRNPSVPPAAISRDPLLAGVEQLPPPPVVLRCSRSISPSARLGQHLAVPVLGRSVTATPSALPSAWFIRPLRFADLRVGR